MRKTLTAMLAAVLFLVALTAAALGEFAEPRSTVKRIANDGGSGSVVVIARGFVLTAAHVAVNPDLSIGASPAKVLRMDDQADIALMAVDVDCPCAPIAAYSPEPDERVIIVGFPFGNSVGVQVLTEGRSQGVNSMHQIVATAGASPGNSGGGLFVYRNERWELAGILTSTFSPFGHYLTLSVDTETLRKFLNGEQLHS